MIPSYRRCCGLLLVALLLSACLTGCTEGSEYARAFDRASSLEDKCYYGTKAADYYARHGSDRDATNWEIKRDLACAELVAVMT